MNDLFEWISNNSVEVINYPLYCFHHSNNEYISFSKMQEKLEKLSCLWEHLPLIKELISFLKIHGQSSTQVTENTSSKKTISWLYENTFLSFQKKYFSFYHFLFRIFMKYLNHHVVHLHVK